MKKILSLGLLVAILLLSLVSCFGGECTVTYVYGDGRDDEIQGVIPFTSPSRPADPVRENYVFNGWYTDEECKNPYSFTQTLTSAITLYAGWIPNYEKLSAAVSARATDACLTVKVTHLKKVGNVLQADTASMGSGVIFKDFGGYLYALTNSHVIELEQGCTDREYTLVDAYGNEYEAELVHDDSTRDLACLRFNSADKTLGVLDFSQNAPSEGDPVIAIGSPLGKPNVATFGTYSHLRKIEVSEEGTNDTRVSFPVMWHSAYLNHGSSGGVLLSTELEIIGVNYATSTDKSGNFVFGFAIPLDEVLAFVSDAGLTE